MTTKRRALLYTRVSTDEQAERGFSLRDQEARLREHCRRGGIEVVGHYQDDHSAKTFDRPAFGELLRALRALRAPAIDLLLVVKWDRFSRDTTGALSMIRKLEEEHGVEVQAVEQPIDRSVPEQLMMLALYVTAPEVENRRRSLATKAGMRRAMKEGRYMGVAPKGFQERARRAHAEGHRPLQGRSVHPGSLPRGGAESGDADGSHTATDVEEGVQVLTQPVHADPQNPLYAGKIYLPAYAGEPAALIDGRHETLIPWSLFEKVQERFTSGAPSKGKKTQIADGLPLRGHLACAECLKMGEVQLVTGSRSRSKTGKRYAYYHCHVCGEHRVRADAANEATQRLLSRIQIAPPVLRLYRAVLDDLSGREAGSRQRRRAELEARIVEMEGKLLRVDEMFVDGELGSDSYQRLKARYAGDLVSSQGELQNLEAGSGVFERHLRLRRRRLQPPGAALPGEPRRSAARAAGFDLPREARL